MPPRRKAPVPLPVEPYFQRIRGSRGFLHAIAEEPDDLASRLIFADWLDEQGHAARAKFIRLQCSNARLPEGHLDHERMEEEARALWSAHRGEWLEGLPAMDGVTWDEGIFAGGLLEQVGIDSARFRVEGLTDLFAVADWRRLWVSNAGVDFLVALLEAPHSANLTSLDLALENRIGDEGARALAEATHLANLTYLDLDSNDIGDEGAQDASGGDSPRQPHLSEPEAQPHRQ